MDWLTSGLAEAKRTAQEAALRARELAQQASQQAKVLAEQASVQAKVSCKQLQACQGRAVSSSPHIPILVL